MAPPANAQTIVILRRDVVAFILPPHSGVSSVAGLAGKAVGIPIRPLQTYNSRTLDTVLSFFDIPAGRVTRVFLPLGELGQAVRARPATPDDPVTTLAVTCRFAASELMSNVVAAAIARSILTAKAKLTAATPADQPDRGARSIRHEPHPARPSRRRRLPERR